MCPSCKSTEVRRSRTQKLHDRVMKWAGLTPYRCRECKKRFYLNRFEDEKIRREQRRARERTAQMQEFNGELASGL